MQEPERPTRLGHGPLYRRLVQVKPRGRTNRQKPSGIAAKETILNVHLVPLLGAKRPDEISSEDIQRLKSQLRDRAPKTVNNVLAVLGVLLKKAWSAT